MNTARLGLIVAIVLFSGCSGCLEFADDNNENAETNNANNTTNNENNANNENNEVPEECTPDFQYEDWSITEDRRLVKACSPYVLERSAEVNEGATLTIDPGVEVQVASKSWIRVGNRSEGKIVANGTEDEPIVFTSSLSNPVPGGWLGVNLQDELAHTSEMSHVIFRYGGEDLYGTGGCLTISSGVRDGSLTLTDATFENCDQGGMSVASNAFAELSRITFRDMDGYGMSLAADIVGAVTEAFTYENVDHNRIESKRVSQSATWTGQPVPYVVPASLEVRGEDDPVLTIDAGTTLQFSGDIWLRVGDVDDGGLVVSGTEEDPVIFESAAGSTAAGDWLGIRFEQQTLAESSIDHAIVRHGGQDLYGTKGCLTVSDDSADRISITNSTFEECAQSGVSARRESFTFAEFTGNTFRDSPYGVDLAPNAISSIGSQSYDGVPANRIDGKQLTASGTWVAQDVPWRVSSSINVRGEGGPILTIEGPNTFGFSQGIWLRVGDTESGGLVVQGTDADPVVFGSSQSDPTPGSWLGIRFEVNTLSGSSLDGAVVRHGGEDLYGTRGCVTISEEDAGRIAVTNSTFESCAQSGIAARKRDFQFETFAGNTFRDGFYGMNLSPNAYSSVEDGQTYDGVDANLVASEQMNESGTWVRQDVPFDFDGSVNVRGMNQPVLTIEAGNVLRFGAGAWLRIGDVDPGGLVAQGTSADRVTFTTRDANPGPGSWLGIRFAGNTLNGTLLDYAHVEYGGEDLYGTRAGVTLSNTGSAVTISNSTFSDNAQGDIYVDGGSTPMLSGNTATVVTP